MLAMGIKLVPTILISRHKQFLIVGIKPLSLCKTTIELEHILANFRAGAISPIEIVAADGNFAVLVFKDKFIIIEVC